MLDVTHWNRVDYSSGGKKGWWIEDPERKYPRRGLVKLPRDHGTYVRWEAGAEVLASRLGKLLGLDVADVIPVRFEETICPMSWDFVTGKYELREGLDIVPIQRPKGRITLDEAVHSLAGYVGLDQAALYVAQMVCFDILIANSDRHSRNWGILVSSQGDAAAQPAPYYDHGAAFGSFYPDDRLPDNMERFDRGFRYEILLSATGIRPGIPELLHAVDKLPCGRRPFVARLDVLTDAQIARLLDDLDPGLISDSRKGFVADLLAHRRDLIREGV